MEISSPDKVLFPAEGITKQQVVDYYLSVTDLILPHLQGRPLTLQRFPNGIDSQGFMQKNAGKYFPDSIERVEVPKEGGTTNHPLCGTVDDLVYLTNQNTITYHIWTARLPDLTRPDRLVIDLDPPENGPPPRSAAEAARQVLADAGLDSGLMTTGSSGYHVVAGLEPEHDYETVSRASRLLAGIVAARHPDEVTTEFLKKDRGGRVFADWLRNRWAQSVVSPWSLRPRPHAPVATPLEWEELADTDPTAWTIRNIAERTELPDPWPGPGRLDPEAVNTLAASHGVRADEPFDRFGRKG